jgi:hypothetical protein
MKFNVLFMVRIGYEFLFFESEIQSESKMKIF